MSVKVLITETFQSATGGTEIIEVEGETIGQCLKAVVKKFPGLEKMWFDGKDKLVQYILVFINGESAHGDSLAQTVKDGDEIFPMLIIGGG